MQTASSTKVAIRPAAWPEDEAVAVRLLSNYGAYLGSNPGGAASICLRNYTAELASLAQMFTEPDGVLLLAVVDGTAAGCVAVKRYIDRPSACEMKRLWVEPQAQGLGVGRLLAQAAIQWARAHGAVTLLLDTVPAAMPQAVALYRSLGFQQTERYNQNPVADLEFFQLHLC